MSRSSGVGVCRGLALLAMLCAWGENARGGSLDLDASSGQEREASRSPRSEEAPAPWDVLHRNRRSWVWNQFFVLEEYTGNEPLYVGKG
uniref:Uncharacterized protein n=1 Tax=Knipowitschia caucasica TaxID=637954 RepID=A0AAV2L600_KNICA